MHAAHATLALAIYVVLRASLLEGKARAGPIKDSRSVSAIPAISLLQRRKSWRYDDGRRYSRNTDIVRKGHNPTKESRRRRICKPGDVTTIMVSMFRQ